MFDDATTFLGVSAKKGGIRPYKNVPDHLPLILGDQRALLQVILNLFTNAVNFTKPGGTVRVSANAIDDGALEIVVADTGVGIHPADLSRICEPFQSSNGLLSRNRGGAGLGIPISKMLVERHGGTI